MPRDFSLESEGQTLHGLAPLSREVHKSPNPNPDFPEDVPLQQSPGPIEMDDPESPQDRLRKDMLDEDRRNELHPFVQTLSSSHVDSCVVVENAAFPENERCTREKFQYRLTTCGELSLGVFTCATTAPPISAEGEAEGEAPSTNPLLDNTPTASVTQEVSSSGPPRKELLLGHIVSTMSANRTILDSDMDIPESWFTSPTNPNSYLMLTPAIRHSERSKLEPQPSAQSSEAKTEPLSPVQSKPSIPEPQAQSSSQSKLPEAKPEPPQSHHPSDPHDPRNEQLAIIRGHNPYGRTIHLHSLAILPQHQKRGLGKTLIKSYMSRIEGSGIADRIALLAHGPLVGFYESLGFKKKGESPAKFGGGGWVDMVYEFPRPVEPPIVSFVDRPA